MKSVNGCSEDIADPINYCSANFQFGISEIEKAGKRKKKFDLRKKKIEKKKKNEKGLNTLKSEYISAPRICKSFLSISKKIKFKHIKFEWIDESPISMECKLYDKMKIGGNEPGGSTLVIGEILCFHINKDCLVVDEKGRKSVDIGNFSPIGRLSGEFYSNIREVFEIKRPII